MLLLDLCFNRLPFRGAYRVIVLMVKDRSNLFRVPEMLVINKKNGLAMCTTRMGTKDPSQRGVNIP